MSIDAVHSSSYHLPYPGFRLNNYSPSFGFLDFACASFNVSAGNPHSPEVRADDFKLRDLHLGEDTVRLLLRGENGALHERLSRGFGDVQVDIVRVVLQVLGLSVPRTQAEGR